MTIRELNQLEKIATSEKVEVLPLSSGGHPSTLTTTTKMTADGLMATITVTANSALILPAGFRSNSTGSSSSQCASSYDEDEGAFDAEDDELSLGANSKDEDNDNEDNDNNNIGHRSKTKQDLGK